MRLRRKIGHAADRGAKSDRGSRLRAEPVAGVIGQSGGVRQHLCDGRHPRASPPEDGSGWRPLYGTVRLRRSPHRLRSGHRDRHPSDSEARRFAGPSLGDAPRARRKDRSCMPSSESPNRAAACIPRGRGSASLSRSPTAPSGAVFGSRALGVQLPNTGRTAYAVRRSSWGCVADHPRQWVTLRLRSTDGDAAARTSRL